MHRKKPKLIWRIFPSFLIIILLSLGVETWYATNYFKNFFVESSEKDLTYRAQLIQDRFARALYQDRLSREKVDDLCKAVGKDSNTRITVVLPTGEVVGDTYARVETMENHRDRPEIGQALSGKKGVAIRYSSTLDKTMMYIALPMAAAKTGRPASDSAVIRTAVSISDIDTRIAQVRNSISLALVLTVAAAAMASLYVSRRITDPVEQMRKGAEEFSKGNLNGRLPAPDSQELSQLARAMNDMAEELDRKIMDVKNRSRELEAIHGSMQEGVIAVDQNEQIITINTAAAKIFDFPPETLKNRNILEVARNFDLQNFIGKALATHEPVEDDIVIERDERLILNIHSTALYDTNERRMGTLIISHDITRIRLLERMHKDFAANVSHELKTPLTTIKGFIETLLGMMGGNEELCQREETQRFLGIIERNVERMIGLVDDLLSLSRLERLKGTDVALEDHPLATLVRRAVSLCREHALSRGVSLEFSCPEGLQVKVDPILMEQAIVNLVDNAVKYNPEGCAVVVAAAHEPDKNQVVIRVTDTGTGIDKVHLPKLFNRFYRVDKGRSRNQGGTGLGLAIAKHIVQYHNGRIEVDSTKGKGTCFTILLPNYA